MAGVVRSPFWHGLPALLVCSAWLLSFLAWPLPAWPLGAAAPFTPPAALLAPAVLSPESSAAAASEAAAAATPILAGIKSGDVPQALIDGRWWSIGERVHGATVVAIATQSVQLRHADGRTESLRLTPQVNWQKAPTRPALAPATAPDETRQP